MRLRIELSALLLAGAAWGAQPAAAEADGQGADLTRALQAAASGDWPEATGLSLRTGNAVAADIVLWMRLRDGTGDWEEYRDFLLRHGDWPGLKTLRRSAERRMPAGLPSAEVEAFFGTEAPMTASGVLRLAEATAATGDEPAAESEIVHAWTDFSLTAWERKEILARWGSVVAPHHVERLDMLLWRGLTSEAEAMLPLVDPDWQKLAQARIATRRDAEGLQYLINTVPASLKKDPGLAYERYLYRVAKGRWQDAEDYLREQSTSATALGRPQMWMDRRANLARQALEDGDVSDAYLIAAQSFGAEGADYADSEWVAGFIALTRLDDPKRAVGHFTRFESLVSTPISVGRAGYWLGEAFARAGNRSAAETAWKTAAAQRTSFYGQLAATRLDLPADPALAGSPTLPDWRRAGFLDWSVVRAARLLHLAGDGRDMSVFLRHAAEGQPPEVRAGLAQMAIDLDRPEIGVRIGKDAAAQGIILPDQYFPLHPIAAETWPVPTEYALAIARQESELDARAASGVGARGLMQLMPATAEKMAEAAGLAFDVGRLGADGAYNARLGTEYLAHMLDRYDGSYVLATAAYNAGPGRVDQWLDKFGDPRSPDMDAVTWIESIPYAETRNYVMRVLESLDVYRARLGVEPAAVQVVSDTDRTG